MYRALSLFVICLWSALALYADQQPVYAAQGVARQLADQQAGLLPQKVPQQPPRTVVAYTPPVATVTPEFRGYVKVDGSLAKMPQLRILFDGRETMNNSEGFFSFPSAECNDYHLVITKKINHHFDKTNTLKSIGIVPNKDYRCFSFKRTEGGSWVQSEKNLTKKDCIIPDRSIVILINPSLVERIESWNLELSSNIIKVPTIVLKKEIHSKNFHRHAAKSLLYSLDSKTFHESIKEQEQRPATNTKVRLALTHPS